ncbi:MFS transporter, partial [Streptantibioticus silvisoli]
MASDGTTAAAPPATPPGTPPASLWRHRPFLALWAGQAVSETGSAVSTLVLPLLAVAVLHATTFQVAALEALGTVPFLLLALPAGVIADRVRKRRLMLGCDLARLLFTASLPAVAWWGHVTLVQLFAVAAGIGVLTVFFDVAYQSCLPALVAPGQLMDANGKLATTEALARFAGPPLGGALTGLFGAARAVTADALSYAASAAALLLMRLPEPRTAAAADRPGFRAAMGEGLTYLARHPILRKVVACTTTANFFGGGVSAVTVVFLVRVLGASPGTVGAVLGLASLGGVAGGLLAGPLTRRIGSARIIWLSILLPAP